MTQNDDFSVKRLTPGYAKVVMALQSIVILLLSFWIVNEYMYNIYFQQYVNATVQADGSLIAILVFVSVLGLALGSFRILKPTHRQIGAPVDQPQAPTIASTVPSSTKPAATDLHPMVAALKADLTHQSSMEPIPPLEIKETPPPPPRVQTQSDPQPVKTQVGTPSTVITGTMPALKRANPDQRQDSQR